MKIIFKYILLCTIFYVVRTDVIVVLTLFTCLKKLEHEALM